MLNKRKNVLVLVLLCILNIGNIYAQGVVSQRLAANERAIPKLVLESFKDQYPDVFLKSWYITHLTYWQNDYSSDWYYGWYPQRTVVVYTYEKPNYFEVEFIAHPGELSRAIYNKYGYWYETRTQIKGLTIGIHDALKTSNYNGWKISPIMEKLDSPAWPVEIYRFHVSKGLKSQIIRMDADGNIIQVKELND